MPEKRVCSHCNQMFFLQVTNKANAGKFCSRKCYWSYLKGKPSALKTGIIKKCCVCNKDFYAIPYHLKKGQGKFCSQKCYGIYRTEQFIGINHPGWKGDKVGYCALHDWVKRKLGKAKICNLCKATNKNRRIEWANIDHKYRRNLNDFISLCTPCHMEYDNKHDNKRGFQNNYTPWNK